MVNEFKEDHNYAHMLLSQRKIYVVQGIEVELAEQSGIPLAAEYEFMGRQAGGRESLGYTKLDPRGKKI